MMRTAAIISEFNPFHTGHARIIKKAKESGNDAVVCIMSGSFVQRGEGAIADKFARAEAALRSGADIVIELPMPFSAAAAEYFARAGVYVADRLGICDSLLFGSELGDIDMLCDIAEKQSSEEFAELTDKLYLRDIGYAAAAYEAYESLYGEQELLRRPNNILAIEYIKALKRLGSDMVPLTVKREDNFSDTAVFGKYPSATALREMIYAFELEKAFSYMPKSAAEALRRSESNGIFPISKDRFSLAVLSALRLKTKEDMTDIEGAGGGLGNRILKQAHESTDYDGLISSLATKKYTLARIRRAVLFSVLGVKHSDMELTPRYVNLLGTSEVGRRLLAGRRKDGRALPIITKNSEKKLLIASLAGSEKEEAVRLFELERRADALYTMCLPKPRETGFFSKKPPFTVGK